MAFSSLFPLPIKSLDVSRSSSSATRSPYHFPRYPLRRLQLNSRSNPENIRDSSNLWEGCCSGGELNKWKRILSAAVATVVIASSSGVPAMAELNRFEADTRGEFGIGSAAQFGSADLSKTVHSNENFRRANFTSADMRESDFSGSTFNGAYLEKAVAYKANFSASDFVVDRACSCFFVEVNHVCNLHKNLEALGKAMEKLKAIRDDVMRRVQLDEDTGLQKFNEVEVWLRNVEIIVNEFRETHTACTSDLEGLSLYEGCSKKLVSRFRYGKDVFSMLEDVEALIFTGKFDAVAGPHERDVVEERPREPIIVGQESILERAWNHLMDDGTQIMGLYGMGGVGKTTLLTQISNKFCGTNDGFGHVIWAVVSSNLQIHMIQEEIGGQIGFKSKEWNRKRENQKAVDIHNFLKRKRFVLLLDDVWGKVELSDIGIPNPTKENRCKIAFTTRSQDVCASMGVHNPLEVKCLGTDDAWYLFTEKVGLITLESHPDILQTARKVVETCRGLPLALKVIGQTMAGKKTKQEWDDAVADLTTYAADFGDVKKTILPILKYSYDNLENDSVKSCLQYCSLFSENTLMEKERLIDYWICEGFIDGYESKERAVNKGYTILGTLVRASLLLDKGKYMNESFVKMHDVVRDTALWIASDLGKHKEKCIVRARVELNVIPKVKDWKVVRRMSLMNNKFEEISGSPECPELTTLLLQDNFRLVRISGEFFKSMPMLAVLDLSWNGCLVGLPEQISALVSLRYLDLSHTGVSRLPVGLQKLRKLIHLNLESVVGFLSVSGISNFSCLKTLRLLNFNMELTMSLLEELKCLEHLEVLTIEINSISAWEQLLYSQKLVRCLQKVTIKYLYEESVEVLTLPAMGNLREVYLGACGMREMLIERNTSLTSPCFPYLSKVTIVACSSLKDLTWLLFAPYLTHLSVWHSCELKEIVSQEKASRIEIGNTVPFQKLEYVHLLELPELESIYWIPLPFPCLQQISINHCQNLRKLPFDSQSCTAGKELFIDYSDEEWEKRVIWEDEATKLHFSRTSKSMLSAPLQSFNNWLH